MYLGLLYGLLSLKSVTVDDFSALAAGRIGNVLLARMTAREAAVFWGGKALFALYYVAMPLAAGAVPWWQAALLLLVSEAVCGWVLALFFQARGPPPSPSFARLQKVLSGVSAAGPRGPRGRPPRRSERAGGPPASWRPPARPAPPGLTTKRRDCPLKKAWTVTSGRREKKSGLT